MRMTIGRAPVWIELGGQLSRLTMARRLYAPTFLWTRADRRSSRRRRNSKDLPLYSIDESGKISFQPDGFELDFLRVRPLRAFEKQQACSSAKPSRTPSFYDLRRPTIAQSTNILTPQSLPTPPRKIARAISF